MTSEGKPKVKAAGKAAGRRILERLKPGEAAAVLRRLLEEHPDLAKEAEEIGRSLLHAVHYEEVAAEIEDEIRALDYDDLNARAGRHEWGYVEPTEAAWEILEEIVSIGIKGGQFHRFGGNHSHGKVAFGHTNTPAGHSCEPSPHSRPGNFQPNINASNYPPARSAGKARVKRGARGSYRGSFPWAGRGRSQRTRNPIGP